MKEVDSNWYRFIQTFRKYLKNLIIFNFVVVSLSVLIALIIPKWYKSTTVILPTTESEGGFNALSALGDLGGLATGFLGGSTVDINRYLAILKSRNLREKVITKYNLIDEYGCDNMEEALEAIDDNLEVEVGDEMQIEISFLDKNQDNVADMTNFIVHCLDSLNISLSTQEAKNNRQFIQSRLNLVIDSLMILQNGLKSFMEKNGILDIENQLITGIENIGQIQIAMLQKQIELNVSKQQLNKNSKVLQKLEAELAEYKKQYDKFFSDSVGQDRLIPPLNKVPELSMEFLWLKKQIEYYIQIIEFLGPQLEQAKIQEAKTIPTLQILDRAVRPEKKHLPIRWLIVLITMVLSSTLSVYYVYWKEYIYGRYFS
ncbi:MAG TPA: hypothetical protein ENK44_11965 [Caldithrix abyssi]|uniref:Polysaccharide chain length determinant N-terminal domain-containing protein n=1 Tax=Caldithrix abyssi TaxID=187145 RepID=A0A7V4U1Q0_CALAY|nr:hypothetical protein [Caldithrix abyssi]